MKLVANLQHSDQSSGTTVFELDGEEYRAHWTEGHSDVVICEGGLGGSIVGMIRADGHATDADWEALKPLLAEPGQLARPMTPEEERDHGGSTPWWPTE